jgi:hypothetical protein
LLNIFQGSSMFLHFASYQLMYCQKINPIHLNLNDLWQNIWNAFLVFLHFTCTNIINCSSDQISRPNYNPI